MDKDSSYNIIKNSRILVVDDHRNIRVSLNLILQNEGAIVSEADCCLEAFKKIGESHQRADTFPFDVILLDIRLPDGNGLDILRKIAEFNFASRVIMISGEGTVEEAFTATQIGAFDYIEKPFNPERVLVSVQRCLDYNDIQTANRDLAKQVLKGQEILGEHPSIQNIHKLVKQVAPTEGRVLILGESGTGKELVAKAIHRESARKHKSLVKVNCAAIPHSLVESELFGHEKGAFTGATKTRKGLFESANGGTLFLDEIGELSLDVQAKLLRVLQNGEVNRVGGEKNIKVDVRLLTATHRDLEGMIQNNEFREDLFYRLNVISIKIPPLRDRKSDVPLLASHFLNELCEKHSVGSRAFSESVLKQLMDYHWPGNVRELINLVERLTILSEDREIDQDLKLSVGKVKEGSRDDLSTQDSRDSTSTGSEGEGSDLFGYETEIVPWQEFHQAIDRKYIKYVLDKTKGNVSEAARLLCLERAYLHRLMKKLNIQRGVVVS